MDRKRVWSAAELSVLNTIAQPVWIYSCATRKLIWGNVAALDFFGNAWYTFKFNRLPPGEQSTFQVLNALIRDEVENGGTEHVLNGFGHTVLPGVLPHPSLPSSEFLYKQAILSLPGQDTTLCTVVQLRTSSGTVALPRTSTVKTNPSRHRPVGRTSADERPTPGPKSGGIGVVGNPSLFDLIDDILHEREVDLDVVEGIKQMLHRGEIMIQSARIEEELVSQEELDQDVGLNLLQLLGSRPAGNRYMNGNGIADDGEPMPSPSPGGKDRSVSLQLGEEEREREREEDREDREFVAASLVPAMEAVLATVDEWRFDAFKLSEATQGHPLSALGFWLMKRYDIIDHFQLDATRLARFLRKVEDGYPDNPYHNKAHAADVLQAMHVLLHHGGLARRLNEELAVLSGYLAAITHDSEHKGLNNDYLVRVSDDLAITYNDMSPMENHHVATSFKLLRHPDFNFVKRMPREKYLRLRRLLIDMVLATDMKQHFNILSKFQAKMQIKLRSANFSQVLEASAHNGPLPLTDDDADKSLIMQVCLKCADVGHLAAPWEVHHRWVSGLEEEFFRQGDKEKARHMMVSPLMDRCKDGITKSQVGFFDIVALPLFYSWATVFHEALPMVRAVEDNCNKWRMIELGRLSSK
mmetsp:Transcript_34412/g.76444  ORF Transcript_34412/g.76444 Transcript_34412/m.76444 type:complete len:639 (+) Transcript_34412:160-2076(+)